MPFIVYLFHISVVNNLLLRLILSLGDFLVLAKEFEADILLGWMLMIVVFDLRVVFVGEGEFANQLQHLPLLEFLSGAEVGDLTLFGDLNLTLGADFLLLLLLTH